MSVVLRPALMHKCGTSGYNAPVGIC